MSVVLLDTTFLIDAERADIDLDDLIHEDDDIAIAAITVAELVVGRTRIPACQGRPTGLPGRHPHLDSSHFL